MASGRRLPLAITMWTGGQRCLTAAASFSPSIEPGMSISVKTSVILQSLSSTAMAASALSKVMTSYPASRRVSSTHSVMSISSSTTRTFATVTPSNFGAYNETGEQSVLCRLRVMQALAVLKLTERQSQMLPNLDHIPRPPCSKCGAKTFLMRVMRRTAGMEVRMFECSKCNHLMEHVVKLVPSPHKPGLQIDEP